MAAGLAHLPDQLEAVPMGKQQIEQKAIRWAAPNHVRRRFPVLRHAYDVTLGLKRGTCAEVVTR
jgi:hypothetical protein